MKTMLAVVLFLLLSACGGGGGGGGGGGVIVPPATEAVHVKCADVYQADRGSQCDAATAKAWEFALIPMAVAAIEVDAGTVSRSSGTLVTSRSDIQNELPSDKVIWVEMRFDANCAGQEGEWIIMPKQAITLDAASLSSIEVGGMCGDMPLGERTLTTTVWDTDGSTVIDFAVVKFTLVE